MKEFYFSGCDEFKCLTTYGGSKNYSSFLKIKDDDINIIGFKDSYYLPFDFIIFSILKNDDVSKKESEKNCKDWFLKGTLSNDKILKIFPNYLKINQVAVTSSSIFGLNKNDGSVYSLNFEDLLIKKTEENNFCEKIKNIFDPKVNDNKKIQQIVSNYETNCFGFDDEGNIYQFPNTLPILALPEINIRKITCGFDHFLLLTESGDVFSWGNSTRGQLGHNNKSIPTHLDAPKIIEFFDDLLTKIIDISCGGWHSQVLTSDGDVYSFGWNESGQLGHSYEKLSAFSYDPFPLDLGSSEDRIISISSGSRHSVATLSSGEIYTWGHNKYGQLGLGDFNNRSSPTRVNFTPANLKTFKINSVTCGKWNTFLEFSN